MPRDAIITSFPIARARRPDTRLPSPPSTFSPSARVHNQMMRRTVLIVPELLGEPSFLRQKLTSLEQIAELGSLFKLAPLPELETPEALLLGLSPEEGQLRQGPLTVAALKADPPERSTHFHLNLMSFDDGVARQIPFEVSSTELRQVLDLAKKLNTKSLTLVEGEGVDHALVWESLGHLRTSQAAAVDGQAIQGHMPDGDGDRLLRQYIDDSINLLSEIELNQRRMDEELPPLNLLWPWGEGVRHRVPNLALRRGEPAMVLSNSLRLAGLARLAGYRHGDRSRFGRLTHTRFGWILETTAKEPLTIIVVDTFAAFRAAGQFEEGEWLGREMEKVLVAPLLEQALREPSRLVVLAPGAGSGLGLWFETGNSGANSIPFDERALDERSLAVRGLYEMVAAAVV